MHALISMSPEIAVLANNDINPNSANAGAEAEAAALAIAALGPAGSRVPVSAVPVSTCSSFV